VKLETAVRKSVKQMTWLTDADTATVELALKYARHIDANGDIYAGPHLINALRSLGGTPESRLTLGVTLKETRGRLAELRAARESRTKAVDTSAS
jgi:hypothetical protein